MHAASSSAATLWRAALLVVVLASLTRVASVGPRPSFVLVVLDTTRFDAVSADGAVAGTTPVIDDLAAHGVRYTRAYSQAHWTLPSHATLFTGLLPSQHGVDWPAPRARDDLTMIAESLHAAGYETIGMSENPWVSERLNLTQGFERFSQPHQRTDEVERTVADWLRHRDPRRPFFLFVNLMDAHPPFAVNADSRFLPEGATDDEVKEVVRSTKRFRLCESKLSEREQAILRAQYLGGVNAADARLGHILSLVRDAAPRESLVTIATSDHGELIGEHGQVDHVFGLYEELIHVPLVVHGLPATAPAEIDAPVELADVAPSLLRWAGLAPQAGIAGRLLPTRASDRPPPRAIVAEHSEPAGTLGEAVAQVMRAGCGPESHLFGDARAVISWPLKLTEYQGPTSQLFALDGDPGEQHDLAGERPAVVAALAKLLPGGAPGTAVAARAGDATRAVPDGETAERLRALGYLGRDAANPVESR